ncbi:MAG: hypothetical protein CL912_30915 [Deltaproteobacteria bacterium]|nr:hypothetical protein [Deltaproteobacteria bacterium]
MHHDVPDAFQCCRERVQGVGEEFGTGFGDEIGPDWFEEEEVEYGAEEDCASGGGGAGGGGGGGRGQGNIFSIEHRDLT